MRRRLVVPIALLACAVAAATQSASGAFAPADSGSAPVARPVVLAVQEAQPTSGMLLASDPDGDAITFSVDDPPDKGTVVIDDAATGAFTYTPDGGATGLDTFTFLAADSTGASSIGTASMFVVAGSPRWPGQTVRMNVANDGTEADGPSTLGGSISADGRYVVFASAATTLAPNIPAGSVNVFLRDRQTGQLSIVSAVGGQPAGGALPTISADGRYVVFTSLSSFLPGGNGNASGDVYLSDRQTGQIERISVSSNGVAGDLESVFATPSADGRYVAFYSSATNLVADDTNDAEDVFLRDRQTGQTTRVSVGPGGVQGSDSSWRPMMSADGRFIAFNSAASNLVPNDTNNDIDVMVRDTWLGQTTRVSVASDGTESNGSSEVSGISADGRFIVFSSRASNLVPGDTNGVSDVFVHDRQTGQTLRVSTAASGPFGSGVQGNAGSTEGTISADGRYVVFRSAAFNLVPNDTNGVVDEFVRDLRTGQLFRVNLGSDGAQANGASTGDDNGCCITPTISADGRSILLFSTASNLVPGDTNGTDDVFVVGPVSVFPSVVSFPANGGTHDVAVTFDYPGTPWTASTTAPWITLTAPIGGSNSGAVNFSVAPNPGPFRTATISVALQTVTVTQQGGGPTALDVANAGGTFGGTTTLSATLTSGGSPFPGQIVSFTLNGNAAGTATTDNSGVATLSLASLAGINAGTYPGGVQAAYAGDGTHLPSNGAATLSVGKIFPTITWAAPAGIPVGTPLSSIQLNATADVPGTFAYSPTFGTLLPVGGSEVLTATFTPADPVNYSGATAHVMIDVNTIGGPGTAAFHAVGDLPGGPFASAIHDVTRVGGTLYGVGASASHNQTLCSGVNNPPGCLVQPNPDTAVLWTFDGVNGALTPLPNLVTPTGTPTNPLFAWAITRDGAYIAGSARSNVADPAQNLAVRVTRNGLVNLNLGAAPFPANNQPSTAQAISEDGSILYGVDGVPFRARRFDVNASTSVQIPLLFASDTANFIATHGVSFDGSVMVGTSFVFPYTGTNGRAYRYVHSSPVGTVSAIPLLAGGTWNKALAVSSDGRIVLVAGNSAAFPNGEIYRYDAVTGVITAFGSPNTPWAPTKTFASDSLLHINFAGMTADGSVIAASFADPTNPSFSTAASNAYIHNANGWFHLTTLLGERGIDIVGDGWDSENLQINGISPDGTLVFGSGARSNDNVEGFVAEFSPGYLSSFDFPAVAPSNTSIVGVWGNDDSSAGVFNADGTFFLTQNHGTQVAGENTSGFERGRYHWDAATGAFTFATLQDTNGDIGLSSGNGAIGITVEVSGDTLSFGQGAIVLQRRTGAQDSVVGGWLLGDPRIDDSSSVLVLLSDGTFEFADDANTTQNPSCHDGVEGGTYVVNSNGTITFNVTIDMDGECGLSNGPGTVTRSLRVFDGGLHLGQPGGPNPMTRIVDPNAVVPVITSPLLAAGQAGTPFTYTIGATWAKSFNATGLPPGFGINTITGVIAGTPTTAGDFVVGISATNVFNSTTSASLTISITPAMVATNLSAAAASGPFGGTTTLNATLTGDGNPLSFQTVSFVLNGTPVGTATTNGLGIATLSGVSLAGISAGSYLFGVQATYAGDGTHVGSAGIASLTVTKAVPLLTWAAPAPIVHGTAISNVQLNATANVPGTFAYLPAAGAILPLGPQTLSTTFTPTDAANYSTTTAQVTITVTNAPPTARNVTVVTVEGTPKSDLLVGIDLENDPRTFSLTAPPSKGTLTLLDVATGAFTYTPNAGAIGYDSFGFSVTDGHGSTSANGSVFIVASAPQWPGATVRASVGAGGSQANGSSAFGGFASADGRFVAFNSEASNLVPDDTNGVGDVFVYDRATGQTTRVSVASDGTEANNLSIATDITPDGRFVAFMSGASNLVTGDTNGQPDSFVHDMVTGETTRISVATDGSQGTSASFNPMMSADGRYIAFDSDASNLVPDDTNGSGDIFVRDRVTGQTTLVSVSSAGVHGNGSSWRPRITPDGRYVLFNSESSNLVAGDTNGRLDVFLRDLWTGQTTREGIGSGGVEGNLGASDGVLSADGRIVAFGSHSSNLVAADTNGVEDVFVRDRQTGVVTRVSVSSAGAEANGATNSASLSADGRYVGLQSVASNLVAGDTNGAVDAFVYDRATAQVRLVSLATDGSQGNGAGPSLPEDFNGPAISADGRFMVFPSAATNLVASDTNATEDVFVVGGMAVTPTSISVPAGGGTRSVSVLAAYPGSPWNATTTTPWITINPPGGGSDSGAATFTIAANSGAARTGSVIVALQQVVVTQEATVAVTVNASPAGAQFSVDGVSYTSSQTFQWVPGSTHSLNAPGGVAGGTRYVFSSWSDGGAIGHNVTAPATPVTYTATFARQYLLSVASAPADAGAFTLVPASPTSDGFYDAGTSVSVRFTPDLRHKFQDWSGDLTGATNPQAIVMSAPRAATANAMTLTQVDVSALPGGTVIVDGQSFSASRTFFWTPGSSHSVTVSVTQVGNTGTQYVFDHLALDGAPVSLTFHPGPFLGSGSYSGSVIAPAPGAGSSSLVFSFRSRFSISTVASPSNGGTITFDPPSFDGFYDPGTVVQVLARPGTNFAFYNWSGDLTGAANPQTLTVNAQKFITASFVPPAIVVTSSPPGRDVVVDDITYTSPAGFVWTAGTQHTISTTASQTAPGSQFTFNSWSDGGDLTHAVLAPADPTIYTATFDAKYQLTTSASPVGGGSVFPGSGGYYPAGQVVSLVAFTGSAYNFGGWSGPVASASSTSTTVTINGPTTVVANFTPAVRLTIYSSIFKYNLPNVGLVYGVYMTACNTGALAAQNVHTSSVTLNNVAYPYTSQLPTVTVGSSSCVDLGQSIFLASIGASGTTVPFKYTVTYTGGSVAASLRQTLPQPF